MSDLVDRVIETTDRDCADWDPDNLRDPAALAIEAVRAYDPEPPGPDQQTDRCSEELPDPFAGAGLWLLF